MVKFSCRAHERFIALFQKVHYFTRRLKYVRGLYTHLTTPCSLRNISTNTSFKVNYSITKNLQDWADAQFCTLTFYYVAGGSKKISGKDFFGIPMQYFTVKVDDILCIDEMEISIYETLVMWKIFGNAKLLHDTLTVWYCWPKDDWKLGRYITLYTIPCTQRK